MSRRLLFDSDPEEMPMVKIKAEVILSLPTEDIPMPMSQTEANYASCADETIEKNVQNVKAVLKDIKNEIPVQQRAIFKKEEEANDKKPVNVRNTLFDPDDESSNEYQDVEYLEPQTEIAEADDYNKLFSPDKKSQFLQLYEGFESSVHNNPGPSTSTQVPPTSSTSTTPMPTKTRQVHPAGWKMPKRRRISGSFPSFEEYPVPNYKSTVLRTNYRLECEDRAILRGIMDGLPDDLETQNEVAPTEEEIQIVNQLKQMVENGDVESWDKLIGVMHEVRDRYAKNNDAAYFHARRRVEDRLRVIYNSLGERPGPDDEEETPKRMTKELKPHQKSGLKFMLWRETQDPCGGILADDMGLGKTMAVIALVAATLKMDPLANVDRPRDVKYKGGTLIIVPASITKQWAEEFNDSSYGIRVLVHHGDHKAKEAEEFLRYHVVITSYYTLVYEKRKERNLLYNVLWKRIVLDEGHLIRDCRNEASKAIFELNGKFRWICTGTPIHNRVEDIYAYMIFLKCEPFNDREIFLKWAKDRLGQCRLNVVLKALLIRRTKDELNLIPADKFIEYFDYDLEPKEAECYKRLMSLSTLMMKVFLNNRAQRKNDFIVYNEMNVYNISRAMQRRYEHMSFQHIMVLLLRLRQLCSHPALIASMFENENMFNDETYDTTINEFDLNDVVVMSQIFNEHIDDKEIFNINNEIFNPDRPSTKIRLLMHILQERFVHTKDKALIICEWPSYLHIISDYLSSLSLSYEYYTGDISMEQRREIVKRFNSDVMNPRILLLSLTCGGIGLNLVKANHVFLMCTHWNPQVERQAEDRCYRIGQERDVHVYKFRAQGTIEDMIVQMQHNKLKLASSMLNGVKSNNYQMTIGDLKSLFGL